MKNNIKKEKSKYKLLLIALCILEILLALVTFLIILPKGNQLYFSLFLLALIINSIILILIILEADLYSEQKEIKPVEYLYEMDNEEIINIIKSNIKKRKYKFIEKEDKPFEKETYIKKEFNGSFINQKLIIIYSEEFNDKLKEKIRKEIELCKQLNKNTKMLYTRESLQIISIVDKIDLDVENFYDTEDTYTITGNYGNQFPYGLYIPAIVDKNKKRIVISGSKTIDESNFITFNTQKNKLIKLFKNIK